MPADTRPWRRAWHDALYAENGFYRRPEGPAGHFRTAVHAAPDALAAALLRLAASAGCTRVLDVGAGRGELLTALSMQDDDLELAGVDVVGRPPDLPARVRWLDRPPPALHDTLLVGWELLDVVACDVAEADGSGRLRVVEVDVAGRERPGTALAPAELAWCHRWWPGPWAPGDRVEVGLTRDLHWRATTSGLVSGLALAVDYDHLRAERPRAGTLTGYRHGRQVLPVPDGTSDLTAHVALDAVAAALPDRDVVLVRQHEAMARLDVGARRPPPGWAASDPVRYLRALAETGAAAELLEPAGLGGFGWLLAGRGSAASVVRRWSGPG